MQIYTLVPVNTLNYNDLGSREMITTKISFLKPHLTQFLSQSNIIYTNIWSANRPRLSLSDPVAQSAE